jgi:hypothetical protein
MSCSFDVAGSGEIGWPPDDPGFGHAETAARGDVRSDIASDDLAAFSLNALGAARTLRSGAAVQRLVDVTVAGLRQQPLVVSGRGEPTTLRYSPRV